MQRCVLTVERPTLVVYEAHGRTRQLTVRRATACIFSGCDLRQSTGRSPPLLAPITLRVLSTEGLRAMITGMTQRTDRPDAAQTIHPSPCTRRSPAGRARPPLRWRIEKTKISKESHLTLALYTETANQMAARPAYARLFPIPPPTGLRETRAMPTGPRSTCCSTPFLCPSVPPSLCPFVFCSIPLLLHALRGTNKKNHAAAGQRVPALRYHPSALSLSRRSTGKT